MELEIHIGWVRDMRGLSLRQLSRMTGISKTALHDYENGKTTPSLGNLLKLAKALHCGIDDLYDSPYQAKILIKQKS